MNYVITYDVIGLIFLALIFVLNFAATQSPCRTSKLFRLFILFSAVAAFLDVFTIWTNLYYSSLIMKIINNLLAVIHIIAVGSIPFVYYIYIIAITHEEKRVSRKNKIFTVTLFGYDILTIATSPFTHLVMYFDENGQYQHGPLFIGTYIILVIFLIAGVIELVMNHKKISNKQFYYVISYTFIDVICAIFQFTHPEYLLIGLSSAASLLVISFTLKNPIELVDNNIGTYNRLAFKEYLYTRSSRNVLVIINIKNADTIKYMYGLDNGYSIIKQCVKKLLDECKQKLGFYVFKNTFVYVCKTEEEAYRKIGILKKYQTTPLQLSYGNSTNEVFLESDCFIIKDKHLLLKNIDYSSRKNSLDQVIDILQFLIQSMHDLTEVKTIDEDFIEYYNERRRIQKIVDKAIKDESFEVFLQPIFDLHTKSFTGAESLIRLRDPDGKMISPALFIPEAEKNGKILNLGDISIKKTCEFIRDGNLAELGIQKVNINLSMVQCMQDNIVEHILSLINNYQIPKEMIRFEITETMTTSSPEKLLNVMTNLSDHGIEFALDDYGTGYSNTSRLMSFPFSEIKFDKSFVDSAMENTKNQLPLKHLMNMVNDSNMIVLVEGIETKEMSELIESFGGSLIQGFYYAKPMPLDEFVEFIKNSK